MVSVSKETAEQTRERLGRVLGQAEFVVLPGAWAFVESPASEPPVLDAEVLAVVRDDDSWSVLRPDEGDQSAESFGVFSFHFTEGLDNSGFVGWLATELKAELGTGVAVICGSNRERGGIYDYWCCPVDLLDDAVAVVRSLAA